MSSPLIEFTERALAKGLERDEISQALSAAGWSAGEVAAALDAFAAVDFPVPVPKPKPRVSARAAFIYLLLFLSLYVSIWSFVSLVFQLIDMGMPNPPIDRWAGDTIRCDIAILIVFFPLFLFMFRVDFRTRAHDPERRTSNVRKWLTYLTLFLAATCFACDLVSLVYYFLIGEFSSRFLLKVMTVAIVASGVFAYFLNDARREEQG